MANDLIKSVSDSQEEILAWIIRLYCPEGFDLDPTYSKGCFYSHNIQEPPLKFDIKPQKEGVEYADCCNLPLESESISSIIFDPPFMFGAKNGPHGRQGKDIMSKRFGLFFNFDELKDVYQRSLREFHRILKSRGILVFKCQDYTDSKTTMTHCLVYEWARKEGFYAEDIFILTAKQRPVFRPNSIQRHARKFHSYFWILRKRKKGT